MYKNTVALIGENAPCDVIQRLGDEGFDVMILKKDTRLPSPVASHADMILFEIDGRIFLSVDYAKEHASLVNAIKSAGYCVVLCDCVPQSTYPHDVLFNIARVGKNVFANMKHIDQKVKRYLADNGYSLHHVNQGYSKCSTVIIGENAIITADRGIAKKAIALEIDVLLINNSSDGVRLDGYAYGFLGGACGIYEGTLYACGDISLHPDFDRINEFCGAHGISICSLSSDRLYDVGGIFFLKINKKG